MSGEAAVIAARAAWAARGRPGGAGKDGGRGRGQQDGAAAADAWRNGAQRDGADGALSNQALWRLAASQHAASEARRRERGKGTPGTPAARGEPYRPWFADEAGGEPWLSAEETGEPWFTQDEP